MAGPLFSTALNRLLRPLAAGCFAVLFPLVSAKALDPGASQFTLEARGRQLEVFTYRPAHYANGPLIVVLHGMNRNAEDYRNNAQPLAERFGALIVAPRFDLQQFPPEAYQRGGVLRDGQAQPVEEWTFAFIGDVVKAVRQRTNQPDLPYYLIGHSAGGQFLTRLAAFLPGEAIRIIAGNPGSLIFPTHDLPFQYGFGGLPESLGGEQALKNYLAAPLTLFLGTADIGSTHLDLTETAMRQGATRLERGRTCFELGRRLAEQKGWPFGWRLVEAEGVGHDAAALFAHPQAQTAIFGK
jgi:poly(3-hydroxybutyrate) depolymerase